MENKMKRILLIGLLLTTSVFAQVTDSIEAELDRLKLIKKDNSVGKKSMTKMLEKGIKISHIELGTGKKPSLNSVVEVGYVGKFKNGKIFDSQIKIDLAVNGVIPCWTIALTEMQVGGKAFIECPMETAYGETGVPGVVPPRTALNFEIYLRDIKVPQPPAAQPAPTQQ